MNQYKKKMYDLSGPRTAEALNKRHFEAYYCSTAAEAVEKVLELTKSIVAEKKITCLMVTHNMHQALELGNRTLMMDGGRIVFDVKGEERSKMTVDDLLEKFRENAGKALDNDRILLSKVEAGN